jgi:hypothetical protein
MYVDINYVLLPDGCIGYEVDLNGPRMRRGWCSLRTLAEPAMPTGAQLPSTTATISMWPAIQIGTIFLVRDDGEAMTTDDAGNAYLTGRASVQLSVTLTTFQTTSCVSRGYDGIFGFPNFRSRRSTTIRGPCPTHLADVLRRQPLRKPAPDCARRSR